MVRRKRRFGWLIAGTFALAMPGAAPPPAEPAGPRLGRTDRDGEPLPPRAIARLGSHGLHYAGSISTQVFSPDGKILATGAGDSGPVTLWEIPSGRVLRRLPVPEDYHGQRLVFSPDGKRLASVVSRHRQEDLLQVWEVDSGRQVLRTGVRDIADLAFAPGGKGLAVGQWDKITLWDPETSKQSPLYKLGRGPGVIFRFTFTPRGKLVVVLLGETSGVSIRVRSGKDLCSIRSPPNVLRQVALSPDGRRLALGRKDGMISLRDVATGKEVKRLRGHAAEVDYLTFSSDGRQLASQGGGTLRLWDLASGKAVLVLGENVGVPAFSPDGRTLATSGAHSQQRVRLWDTATGKERHPFPGHVSPVTSVDFSPDGRVVVTASELNDPFVCLWDPGTGRLVRQVRAHAGGVLSFALSPDGKRLVTGGWDRDPTIRLWDVATGAPRRRLDAPGTGFRVALSPDGKWLAAAYMVPGGTGSGGVRLWDFRTGKQSWHVPGPEVPSDLTRALAFSPDSRTLVKGGERGLTFFDVPTGRPRPWRPRRGEEGDIMALAFSPDGRVLATTHHGSPTRLWEVASRREALQLPEAQCLAFSPEGRFVAAGKTDGTINLFDLARDTECLKLHPGTPVYALAFSPDGKRLVSGGEDTTALVWDVADLASLAPRRTGPRPGPAALRRWWADLLQTDARVAHRAAWKLVEAGTPALRFLEAEVKPAPAADPARTARLIKDLGDDNFAVRETATRQLQEFGSDAEQALRTALAGKLPPEARRRVRRLLGPLDEFGAGTEQLRALRALGVLEHIGTPEARDVLRKLARGAPRARLTREAREALTRLEKAPARR